MSRIKVGGSWCYHDQLDGHDIQDGERLLVTWGDGSQEEISARVETSTTPILDHGHTFDCSVRRAYHRFEYHGTTAHIRLAGIEARRVP